MKLKGKLRAITAKTTNVENLAFFLPKCDFFFNNRNKFEM